MARLPVALLCVLCFFTQTEGMTDGSDYEPTGFAGLLMERIQNLEQKIDIDMKIMQKEFKREINRSVRRKQCGGTNNDKPHWRKDVEHLRTALQTIVDKLDTVFQRQNNVTETVVSLVSADVTSLVSSVNSLQRQLTDTDARIVNLTLAVDDINVGLEALAKVRGQPPDGSEVITEIPEQSQDDYNFTTALFILNVTSTSTDAVTMTSKMTTTITTPPPDDYYYQYYDDYYEKSEHGIQDESTGNLHQSSTKSQTPLVTPTQTSTSTNASTTVRYTEATTTEEGFSLRLVDGLGPWEGRVEVWYQGEWGSICDDLWDDLEAKVVCRMLGYTGGEAFGFAKYGPGTGRILMNSVYCSGEEASLFDCHFDDWLNHGCSHNEDSSVRCIPEVHVDSVRLVDGDSNNVGRVEITVNNVTGSICDDHFDFKAANVLCKMLGFGNGGEVFPEATYGEGDGPVIFDDVICEGNEESLVDCQHRQPFTSNCGHDEDISVRCFLNNTLVNRPPEFVQEASKIVYFSSDPVELPCVATGIPEPQYRWTFNGEGFNVTDTKRVTQSSTDGTLIFTGPGPHHAGYYQCFADNGYGVAVSGKTNLRQAVLFDYNDDSYNEHKVNPGSTLRLECATPHSDPPAVIHWEVQGPDYGWKPLALDETMTVNFEDGSLMILDVRHKPDMDDRALGCVVTNTFLNKSVRGKQNFIIITDAEEEKKTPTQFWPDSPMNSTVSKTVLIGNKLKLLCIFDGNPVPEIFWEKTDGNSKIPRKAVYTDSGRILEIGNFTEEDAGQYECWGVNSDGVSEQQIFNVIAEAVPYWTEKPQSIDAVIGDEVNFTCLAGGTPEPTYVWTIDGLPLSDFLPPTTTPAPFVEVRLVDGDSPLEGRVEVWYNGQWSTVCNDYWDNNDAQVACRMLGYRGGTAGSRYHSSGYPRIYFQCRGYETSLFNCPNSRYYSYCYNYAGVSCSPVPTTVPIPAVGLEPQPLKNRLSLIGSNTLEVSDVTLDDHMNIQCNASNKHGYVYTDFYLNVGYSKP